MTVPLKKQFHKPTLVEEKRLAVLTLQVVTSGVTV